MTITHSLTAEKHNKFLAVCAFIFTAAPVAYTVVFFLFGLAPFADIGTVLPLAAAAALVAAGYGLQDFYGRLTRTTRAPAGGGSEPSYKKYVIPKKMVIPLAVAFIAAVTSNSLTHAYLKYRASARIDAFYDPYSMLPAIIAVVVFSLLAIGTALWFYPYDRLVNLRSTIVSISVFLMIFIVAFITKNIHNTSFITWCLAGFAVSSFLALNQDYLVRIVRGAEFSVLTDKMRAYNRNMVFGYYAASFVVVLAALSVIIGAAALFRLILVTLIGGFAKDEMSAYQKPKEAAERVYEGALGGIENVGNIGGVPMFIYIFILIILLTIVFFIVFRNRDLFERFVELLNNFLKALLEMFEGGQFARSGGERETLVMSYRDEEVLIAARRPDAHAELSRIRNYRDFAARLNKIDDIGEKVSFAYIALLERWKSAGLPLRDSDTARGIRLTVERQTDVSDYARPTDVMERLKYSGGVPSPEDAAGALDELCGLAMKYFG